MPYIQNNNTLFFILFLILGIIIIYYYMLKKIMNLFIIKWLTLIKITKTGIERLGASVINLAKHENLEGHAYSVKIRLKKGN